MFDDFSRGPWDSQRVEGRAFTFDIHAESELDTHVNILNNLGKVSPSASWLISAARSVILPRVSAAEFSDNALCKISPPLFLMSDVFSRGPSLGFPNDADACRICAIAQIRYYRWEAQVPFIDSF